MLQGGLDLVPDHRLALQILQIHEVLALQSRLRGVHQLGSILVIDEYVGIHEEEWTRPVAQLAEGFLTAFRDQRGRAVHHILDEGLVHLHVVDPAAHDVLRAVGECHALDEARFP